MASNKSAHWGIILHKNQLKNVDLGKATGGA